MSSETSPCNGRRLWLGALLLGLFGCLAAGAICAAGFLHDQQNLRQQLAEQTLRQQLGQSKIIAANYVQQRRQARQDLQQRLNREAADICGNVQIFLQTALVRQESRQTALRNTALQSGRDELAKLLRQQNEIAAKMASALGAASASITSITPVTNPADPANPAAEAGTTEAAPPQVITAAPSLSDEEKTHILQEFATLQAQTGQQIAKAAADSEAKSAEAKDWTARLLRESGADIEGFLPAYGSFTVLEAGGRVLLTLGSGSTAAGPNAIRAEATRNLLLPAGAENKHWILRVILNDLTAPAHPGGHELAQQLGERLGLQAPTALTGARANSPVLTGVVYDANGSVAGSFPPGAQIAAQNGGSWRESSDSLRFSAREKTAAPAEWEIALEIALPVLPANRQLAELARQNPAAVLGFAIALVLLLVGILINARLAWRGAAGGISKEDLLDPAVLAALTRSPGLAQPKPVLGSLERLQQANRGRQGEGSRILDLAKSPVLRDLAAHVRNNAKSVGKEDRLGLREYQKSQPK